MVSRYAWILAALGLLAPPVADAETSARQLMPTSYEAGHFFVTPRLADGNTLRVLVDSGGGGGSGWYMLGSAAVKRLRLPTATCNLDGSNLHVVTKVPFRTSSELVAVPGTACSSVALVNEKYAAIAHEDGVLGAGYLPHFIWTFNYPRRQLWRESANWKPADDMRSVRLHFLENANGDKVDGMPRIIMTVAGESIDMLLDTGATAAPTDAGERAAGTPIVDGIGVTSYITTSMMERWHRRHPTWLVIDDADKLMHDKTRMIRVPQVDIAGWSIGPVWFTERADKNFIAMSDYMDAPVHGSAGANIWQHFRMTLDYSRDKAWFACISGCAPVQ